MIPLQELSQPHNTLKTPVWSLETKSQHEAKQGSELVTGKADTIVFSLPAECKRLSEKAHGDRDDSFSESDHQDLAPA